MVQQMNNAVASKAVSVFYSGQVTMSSREISDLVESRHADVCRTIERLAAAGAIQGYTPTPYTHLQNGRTYKRTGVYQLCIYSGRHNHKCQNRGVYTVE